MVDLKLSWNEIYNRALKFSKDWKNASDEKSQAQLFLRQYRVYRDKKIAKGRRRARKAKRGRATPVFCSERTIIRPRDQNAYQRDKDLQEQIKKFNLANCFRLLRYRVLQKPKRFLITKKTCSSLAPQ